MEWLAARPDSPITDWRSISGRRAHSAFEDLRESTRASQPLSQPKVLAQGKHKHLHTPPWDGWMLKVFHLRYLISGWRLNCAHTHTHRIWKVYNWILFASLYTSAMAVDFILWGTKNMAIGFPAGAWGLFRKLELTPDNTHYCFFSVFS